MPKRAVVRVSDLLRAPTSGLDLAAVDTRATPGFEGGKTEGREALPQLGAQLAGLQEQLYADGRTGGNRKVLLVLQGMDTSGKGGTVGHVLGQVDPAGVLIAAFKRPTPEELAHDFLWRIRKQVPAAGMIGVFDRSHYEDVLVVRVDGLVPEQEWRARYGAIRDFEAELAAAGVAIVKCMLHISPEAQQERLLARLDDPAKRWKYNPGDVDVRGRWADYRAAYTAAVQETDADSAPWYIVPADRKWYRNWAVSHLLLETLEQLKPRTPTPDFDPKAELARLTKADPLG
jgi:PPK2 family polyphosphate:nucleotide phosphotransferase